MKYKGEKDTTNTKHVFNPLKAGPRFFLILAVLMMSVLLLYYFIRPIMVRELHQQSYNIEENEKSAVVNLERIFKAQRSYFSSALEPDFGQSYCRFLTHLYKQPEPKGGMSQVSLISRKLSEAIGKKRGIDGYYFDLIRFRYNQETKQKERLNYNKEWAAIAIPVESSVSGNTLFFINNAGVVVSASVWSPRDIWPVEGSDFKQIKQL